MCSRRVLRRRSMREYRRMRAGVPRLRSFGFALSDESSGVLLHQRVHRGIMRLNLGPNQ